MIDNRGCGRTKAPVPLALSDMVSDCVALLDKLGVAQADLLCHSMGGVIAQNLSVKHPERVKRIVSLTSSDRLTRKIEELFTDLAQLYAELPPMRWFRLLFQWLFSEPFFADANNVRAAAAASAMYPYRQSPENFAAQFAAAQAGVPADLTRIRCSVLALAAERDLIVPPSEVQRAHAPIPDHRVELIANAAHSIHWEAPHAVAEKVRAFLT
jgi:aminoacrylate hydrolase